MGRKAKLRQGRDRQAPLGFDKSSPCWSYEKLGPGGLFVYGSGYDFYATEVVTGTKQVEDVVQCLKRKGRWLPKDVLMMPYEVSGRAAGLAFFAKQRTFNGDFALELAEVTFVPDCEYDEDVIDLFESGIILHYLHELFGDLLIQGKIVSPRPIFFSVSQ